VCKLLYQLLAHRVAAAPGVVVQEHRRIGHRCGYASDVALQLLVGGLDEHRLQDRDGLRSHRGAHPGETDALGGADVAHAHVHRHPAGRLVHHDRQGPFHLILLHHVELPVGAEGQDARAPAFYDEVDEPAKRRLVQRLVLFDRGHNRGDDPLDEGCIHAHSPIVVPDSFA